MGRSDDRYPRPFRRRLALIRGGFAGAYDDGGIVSKPAELLEAELVDGLCQRWGQPPSVILRENAGYVLRMLTILGFSAAGDPSAEPPPPSEDGLVRGLLVNQS